MEFKTPLIEATLLRRYKRFLADVRLSDGEVITVHTANTGSMLGCAEPGSRVWLSRSESTTRKYPYSWEISEAAGVLVGINTALPNALVREAIEAGVIVELQGYRSLRGEVPFGSERSRVDWLLQGHGDQGDCYVEVKNVTAAVAGTAIFPDAVSARGAKHLRELMGVVAAGQRGVLCFCVQRGDVTAVRPADEIDSVYGETLRRARQNGVELIAYQAEVSPAGIALRRPLPVLC
jgi:sugar fermentation stimulation protein A